MFRGARTELLHNFQGLRTRREGAESAEVLFSTAQCVAKLDAARNALGREKQSGRDGQQWRRRPGSRLDE